MLIGDIAKRNAKLYPQKTAVIEGSVQYNFYEFNNRVNRLSNAIIGLGLQKGEKVAVLNHNCFQYIEIYFALAKAGTPSVPLNFRLNKDELAYVINHSESGALLFGSKYLPIVEEIKSELSNVKHFICIDTQVTGFINYDTIMEDASDIEPDVEIAEEDIVILGYTGGTTGLPKGVMTSHRNLITSCYNTAIEMAIAPDSRYLNAPPLFHAGDAMGMFGFSFVGGTNVVMSAFSPEEAFIHIDRFRITHPLFVPAMIIYMLQYPDINKFDLSSLQTVLYGTAPMPLAPLKQAMATFKCGFLQVYGATETFVPISMLKPEDHIIDEDATITRRMESAGREVIGVEVKVVDDNENEVSPNEVGEIIVKGNNVMSGYWQQPDLTQKVLRNGWYYTGDMGKVDPDGYIYIVDRKKDMIITGGENVYPKEVENVLGAHPAVQEVAVIGVPHEIWGEAVKAFIIIKQGKNVDQDALKKLCKDKLAGYKQPQSFEFVEDLPRSSAGKILKREIREKYWAGKNKRI